MHAGIPLTDEDRWPWLRALRAVIEQALADNVGAVVTCSALKRAYRDVLAGGLPNVHYVHLTGDPSVLAARLAGRSGHFMNPALLDSQIATLEAPADAIDVDVALTPDQQVAVVQSSSRSEVCNLSAIINLQSSMSHFRGWAPPRPVSRPAHATCPTCRRTRRSTSSRATSASSSFATAIASRPTTCWRPGMARRGARRPPRCSIWAAASAVWPSSLPGGCPARAW